MAARIIETPITRAMNAYFRRFGREAAQPSNASGIEVHDGRELVVLRNVSGVLAALGIGPSGRLVWLNSEQWPATLRSKG